VSEDLGFCREANLLYVKWLPSGESVSFKARKKFRRGRKRIRTIRYMPVHMIRKISQGPQTNSLIWSSREGRESMVFPFEGLKEYMQSV